MKKSVVPVLVAGAVLLAGCGGGSNSSGGGTPTTSNAPSITASGKVQVLYAGSLANLMEHDIGPAFASATGGQYEGTAAG